MTGIVGVMPNQIADGQTNAAGPVMANFNWIMAQVNANAAGSGVNGDITQLTALTSVNATATGGAALSVASAVTVTGSVAAGATGGAALSVASATNLTGSGTVSATTTGGAGLTPTNSTNAVNVTGTVASAATGTTQAIGNNSTLLATTAYADTHVQKDNGSVAVGSYNFCALAPTNTVNNGATVAGSQLQAVNFQYDSSAPPGGFSPISSITFSGTWRNVSGRNLISSGSVFYCGMFQRIS